MSPFVALGFLRDNPTAQEIGRATHQVRRLMARTLKKAGLPRHFTPHSLRHTFCSLPRPCVARREGVHGSSMLV